MDFTRIWLVGRTLERSVLRVAKERFAVVFREFRDGAVTMDLHEFLDEQ